MSWDKWAVGKSHRPQDHVRGVDLFYGDRAHWWPGGDRKRNGPPRPPASLPGPSG